MKNGKEKLTQEQFEKLNAASKKFCAEVEAGDLSKIKELIKGTTEYYELVNLLLHPIYHSLVIAVKKGNIQVIDEIIRLFKYIIEKGKLKKIDEIYYELQLEAASKEAAKLGDEASMQKIRDIWQADVRATEYAISKKLQCEYGKAFFIACDNNKPNTALKSLLIVPKDMRNNVLFSHRWAITTALSNNYIGVVKLILACVDKEEPFPTLDNIFKLAPQIDIAPPLKEWFFTHKDPKSDLAKDVYEYRKYIGILCRGGDSILNVVKACLPFPEVLKDIVVEYSPSCSDIIDILSQTAKAASPLSYYTR